MISGCFCLSEPGQLHLTMDCAVPGENHPNPTQALPEPRGPFLSATPIFAALAERLTSFPAFIGWVAFVFVFRGARWEVLAQTLHKAG